MTWEMLRPSHTTWAQGLDSKKLSYLSTGPLQFAEGFLLPRPNSIFKADKETEWMSNTWKTQCQDPAPFLLHFRQQASAQMPTLCSGLGGRGLGWVWAWP